MKLLLWLNAASAALNLSYAWLAASTVPYWQFNLVVGVFNTAVALILFMALRHQSQP